MTILAKQRRRGLKIRQVTGAVAGIFALLLSVTVHAGSEPTQLRPGELPLDTSVLEPINVKKLAGTGNSGFDSAVPTAQCPQRFANLVGQGSNISGIIVMKKIAQIRPAPPGHWVGDGFPVRSLISYDRLGQAISPFLLLDYAGPHHFEAASRPRGVGEHPHRGFETVTIVYEGEVAHRDSTGEGGVIGPGDVQWMTAASGILHEEFHSPAFTEKGGPFRMVQLWINLPAKDKMSKPGYQAILNAEIPSVELSGGAGRVRVIAGAFDGVTGPARTFTPINMWDIRLNSGASTDLEVPEGHTVIFAVLSGRININDGQPAREAETVLFEREGSKISVRADEETLLMVLTGEPIGEPIAGAGPFVMNTREELNQAYADFRNGRF